MSGKCDPGYMNDDSFDELIATQGHVFLDLLQDSTNTGPSTTCHNEDSPSILAPCHW